MSVTLYILTVITEIVCLVCEIVLSVPSFCNNEKIHFLVRIPNLFNQGRELQISLFTNNAGFMSNCAFLTEFRCASLKCTVSQVPSIQVLKLGHRGGQNKHRVTTIESIGCTEEKPLLNFFTFAPEPN